MLETGAQRKVTLIGYRGGASINIHKVRDLTDAEVNSHREHTRTASSAIERFSMFRILLRNFKEWEDYLRSLFQPGDLRGDEKMELNRLLSNYLASARATVDHFKIAYADAFRGTDKKDDFKAYLKRVIEQDSATAFFQDFRNYVQHCGLPVGNFSRKFSKQSIVLSVKVDANQLLRDYKDWQISKLSPERGFIDLIDELFEYHICTMQNVASFLARAFFPTLIPAHNFYAKLAVEVASSAPPDHKMVFMEVHSETSSSINCTFEDVPSHLFGELGFNVFPKAEAPSLPPAEA